MQHSIRISLLIKLLLSVSLVITLVLVTHIYIIHERIKTHTAQEIALTTQNTRVPAKIHTIHNALEKKIIVNIIWIIISTLIILAIAIWFSLKKELANIHKITKALKRRALNDLHPVTLDYVPTEIKPLIEELNNLFLRLQDAFLREERFASDAAHELRTPLAALRAHVHVALHASTKKERDHALHRIDEGIERCTHVINQLSILSRATRQKHELMMRKPMILSKEAKNVIAELYPLAKKKNIDVELNIVSKPEIAISGNPITIGILIRNLVDNAIRYSDKNSIVQVMIDHDRKHVFLKVVDNGPGIPENMRERVFERFFRIADSSIQGSGLGLSIVQQIAKKHHAEIKLATPKTGKGLEVDVIFKIFK